MMAIDWVWVAGVGNCVVLGVLMLYFLVRKRGGL